MTITYITSGQTRPGDTITAGNTLDVISGGTAISPTVIDGGFSEVFGGGTAINSTISAGTEQVDADGVLAGAVIAGGTLELVAAGPANSGAVSFTGPGTLRIDAGIPGFVVSGFQPGDSVDFRAVSPAATSITGTVSGVAVNGVTFPGIAVSGPGAPQIGPDGAGGTLVTVACFAAGTRILTAAGEVAVENIRAGDHVMATGPTGARLRPVRWTGHRTLAPARRGGMRQHRHRLPPSVLQARQARTAPPVRMEASKHGCWRPWEVVDVGGGRFLAPGLGGMADAPQATAAAGLGVVRSSRRPPHGGKPGRGRPRRIS